MVNDSTVAVPVWQLKLINQEHVKVLILSETVDSLVSICDKYRMKIQLSDSIIASFSRERELYNQRITSSDSAYYAVKHDNQVLEKRNKNLVWQRNILILAAAILLLL